MDLLSLSFYCRISHQIYVKFAFDDSNWHYKLLYHSKSNFRFSKFNLNFSTAYCVITILSYHSFSNSNYNNGDSNNHTIGTIIYFFKNLGFYLMYLIKHILAGLMTVSKQGECSRLHSLHVG